MMRPGGAAMTRPAIGVPSPTEILQRLVQFDTANPPGNEGPCIAWIARLLNDHGISSEILAKDPARPNLVARLPGRGEAPPLLFYGHVDVVPADTAAWGHPPFSGAIAEGCVWGRGALDMKGGVAMMLSALLRLHASGEPLAGDLLFMALADEEAGGDLGARYVVDEHPHVLRSVRHAIGEFGGFPLVIGGRTLYLVQVAEKAPCLAEVTVRGRGGHGAFITRGEATAKAAKLLRRLERRRFPIHITEAARRMIRAMAQALPLPTAWGLRLLLVRGLGGLLLRLPGLGVGMLEPALRNTATATVIRGGDKPNVVPKGITLTLDCRRLPGVTPDRFLDELQEVIGSDAEVQLDCLGDAPADVDMTLFPTLAAILSERTGGAAAVPLLQVGSTDARHFARLGIQTYGFLPMDLPASFPFLDMVHAADERIPVRSLEFGTECMLELIRRYPGAVTASYEGRADERLRQHP
ncbi:MAG: M20/M25/M40 family metallo-hydrolase [Candidatus Bipolaricaulota bacterium]|nr:MAG: M20/M25/M40 family metallo-hydrolase [Candidatus Bipolaricaulota bacterium]